MSQITSRMEYLAPTYNILLHSSLTHSQALLTGF